MRYLNRWDAFNSRKMDVIAKHLKVKRKQEAIVKLIAFMCIDKTCKYAYSAFFQKQRVMRARIRLLFYLRIQLSIY